MSNMLRFSPNHEMYTMQNEIDQIFNQFFPVRRSRTHNGVRAAEWIPSVDLRENDDSYALSIDLPGMNKKDIEINFQDDVLTISGERVREEKKEGDSFLRVERKSGKFTRSFRIPNRIQNDKINATYKDGVLNVTLLKADEVKPVKIKVA